MIQILLQSQRVLETSETLKQKLKDKTLRHYEVSNALETLETSIQMLTRDVIPFWSVTLKVAFVFLAIFIFGSFAVLFVYTNIITTILCIFSGLECISLLRQCYLVRKNTYLAQKNFYEIRNSIRTRRDII